MMIIKVNFWVVFYSNLSKNYKKKLSLQVISYRKIIHFLLCKTYLNTDESTHQVWVDFDGLFKDGPNHGFVTLRGG